MFSDHDTAFEQARTQKYIKVGEVLTLLFKWTDMGPDSSKV